MSRDVELELRLERLDVLFAEVKRINDECAQLVNCVRCDVERMRRALDGERTES